MKKLARRLLASATSPTLLAATMMLAGMDARAQCPATELISGLQIPLGITQSNQGNLLVGETGTPEPNTGRISIVDPDGNRRTLLDGLPSGINDVLEPSGPAGVFVRGRTIYIASGIGDSLLPGPVPGTALGNPNPSSPIFSSVLAVHLSANAEKITEGFTLSLDEHEALADGETVNLSNGGGDKARIEMIANFPDFIPNPLPFFTENVRGSNPFDLVAVANQLYVTDGGRNLVWKVDIHSGEFSALAAFPPITNPLFPIGPPVTEAVPTGIRYSDGQLLVALFRGAPFPTGASQLQSVDPRTGAQSPFITDLTTAIDVLAIRDGDDTDWLVLQHSSEGPFFGGTGLLLRFESPGDSPTVLADCLELPTSMSFDPKSGTVFVTELGGRIVTFSLAP